MRSCQGGERSDRGPRSVGANPRHPCIWRMDRRHCGRGFFLDTPPGASVYYARFSMGVQTVEMLIEVSKIPPEGLHLALPAEELDLGNSAGLWEGPASVRAELYLGRSGRGLLIGGTFVGDVVLICSRCLESFRFQAQDRFDLYCALGLQAPEGEERELAVDELDVTYIEEGRINTDHLLRENVLLGLPVQPVCREDCRGLCSRCGANLNLGSCGCQESHLDPRLAILRKLR